MTATTYYMVEMDYPHKTEAERAAFDGFYDKHISMLLTIPGFLTAQRFYCDEAARAPFLALYRLVGPEVMDSEAYTSKAGRMSVDPAFRVNMVDWDRNLAQGAAADIAAVGGTPDGGIEVAMGGALVLVDRLVQEAAPLPGGYAPLAVIGLDETVAQRGVKVVPDAGTAEIGGGHGHIVRRFLPIHEIRKLD